MKKFLVLLVIGALLLCMTACSSNNKKDLSALEEYTSGELRALMVDAREIADSRFDEIRDELAKELVKNMQGLGYPLEIASINKYDIRFALQDDPSVEFWMFHHTVWRCDIDGNVTHGFLMDWLGSMAKALAQVEKHPDAFDEVADYAIMFEETLLIESLSPGQTCQCYNDGYLYSIKKYSDSSGYGLYIE